MFYLATLRFLPIRMHLSFMPLDMGEEEKVEFATLASALGMALTAIELAPIRLYSIELKDVYGS